MAVAPFNVLNDDKEEPNHMIFWLDVSIGDPRKYTHLKRAFGSNTDPRCETWTMLTDTDYHNILVEGDAVTVTFEGVQFLLQAFTSIDTCLQAFEEKQDKRIFFITSGSLGEAIVPKIIEQYRHIFTDRITNDPYPTVYVFCHDISRHALWATDYIDYVKIFDFDADLLERMTHDIAEYFMERCRQLRQDNNLKGALQRLHWAKRLQHQHDKMRQKISTDDHRSVRETSKMRTINELITEIEAQLPKELGSDEDVGTDDDEKPSEPCE